MNLKEIRHVVERELDVNLMDSGRKIHIVDGRRIYTRLACEKRYSYVDIGRELGKDHATVIHYQKTFDGLMRDKSFAEKYFRCLAAYDRQSEKQQSLYAHYNVGFLMIEKNRLESKLERINELLNKQK